MFRGADLLLPLRSLLWGVQGPEPSPPTHAHDSDRLVRSPVYPPSTPSRKSPSGRVQIGTLLLLGVSRTPGTGPSRTPRATPSFRTHSPVRGEGPPRPWRQEGEGLSREERPGRSLPGETTVKAFYQEGSRGYQGVWTTNSGSPW